MDKVTEDAIILGRGILAGKRRVLVGGDYDL